MQRRRQPHVRYEHAAQPEPVCIQTLPEDIVRIALPSQLSRETMGVLPRVSRFLHTLFQTDEAPWKANLINQFGIHLDVLARLETLRSQKKGMFHYRQLYKGVYRLFTGVEKIKEKYLQHMVMNERYQFLVLVSCANDPSLTQWISREDRNNLLKLSIYAGSYTVDATFIHSSPEAHRKDFFEFVIYYGSMAAARACITHAIEGELSVVNHLLTVFLEFFCGINAEDVRSQKAGLVPDLLAIFLSSRKELAHHYQPMLEATVLAGNVEDVSVLFQLADADDRSQQRPKPSLSLTEDLFVSAAKSVNEEMFVALLRLNRHTHIDLKSLLDHLADDGVLHAVQSLLTLVVPDNNTLDRAAASKNVDLFRFLFHLTTPDGERLLTPRSGTLELAFFSGKVEIVREIVAFNRGLFYALNMDFVFSVVLEAQSFEMAHEILSYRKRNGNLLINISKAISEIARYGNVQLLHAILLFYQNRPRDLQTNLTQEAFSRAVYSGFSNMVRELLSLRNEHGEPLFIPTLEYLSIAIESDNPDLPFELLDLKDAQANPLLIPTVAELNRAIDAGHLKLVYTFLAYDGSNGRPFIELNTTSLRCAIVLGNIELLLDLLAHSRHSVSKKLQCLAGIFRRNIFRENKTKISCFVISLLKLDSAQTAMNTCNFQKAKTRLQEAYQASPGYFFEAMTTMLEENLNPFLIAFTKELIESERRNPALPPCELETLNVMSEKLIGFEQKLVQQSRR